MGNNELVEARPGIPCVVYAAKSTPDPRGSIPGQLEELREKVQGDPLRRLVAEYRDEAYSRYSGDRGPGLVWAREHGRAPKARSGP